MFKLAAVLVHRSNRPLAALSKTRRLLAAALVVVGMGAVLQAYAQGFTETSAECRARIAIVMDEKIAKEAASGEAGEKRR